MKVELTDIENEKLLNEQAKQLKQMVKELEEL